MNVRRCTLNLVWLLRTHIPAPKAVTPFVGVLLTARFTSADEESISPSKCDETHLT